MLLFRRLFYIIAIVLLFTPFTGGQIPAAAQGGGSPIQLLQNVTGEISDIQTEQRWSFDGIKGRRIAVRMQATAGDLDPFVELLDKTGKALISSTSTSLRNATIDAYTLPDNQRYTLRATRTNGNPKSVGGYVLSLLPGFSFVLLNDPSGGQAPMRTWRNASSYSRLIENKLEIQLTQDNAYTWTNAPDRTGAFRDVYMQVEVTPTGQTTYWEAGLLLRGVKRGDSLAFYVFFINSDNKWKLALAQPTGLDTIKDWQPIASSDSPGTAVILASAGSPITLGMMARDKRLTLFYNSQTLGEVTDDKISDAGTFGVALGTGKGTGTATLRFANFLVTLPADDAAKLPITVPEKLSEWNRSQEAAMVELRQLRLVPSTGKLGLELKTKAFVTNNTALGIVTQPLAESLIFTDLVLTADVTWEASNDNIACALEARVADDSNFIIVYLDRKGGYGIRQQAGQDVPISIYNLHESIQKDNLGINRVNIIAMGNNLIVYLNGNLIGNMTVKRTSGGVRIAAYNYQRASSICQFTNVWLRSFDQ